MALSNKFGWLVLTTGNKSETSVGYSTLYGDMAGGFAVLKDVPKTLVYRLARQRNERRPAIPERMLTRPPTAELRPDQRDQDTLPPYDVLDPILEAYVEEDRSVAEIVASGLRPGDGAARDPHGGPRRVQAPPGPPGREDHAARVRPRPPAADHEPLAGITGPARQSAGPLAGPGAFAFSARFGGVCVG